jgi:hypothetical protein
MAEGSDSQKDEREDVVASGLGNVVKTEPSEVVEPKPEPAPAEEGDEITGFEDQPRELLRGESLSEIAKLADESAEFRRHLELDRAARFHLGIGFKDPDPVLGLWAPACTTNLVAGAIEEGYVEEYLKTREEIQAMLGKHDDDHDAEGERMSDSSGTAVELSCKSIASVDDLAELLLTSTGAKRMLIAFGGLAGSEPTDHPGVLAERLLARHGTELSVRKILDAAPAEEVVGTLSNVVWEGHEGSYVLARQGNDAGSLRAAVLCLTSLVTAHLEKGAKGVDSVANSTPLLKLVGGGKTEQARPVSTATDPHTHAMLEQVANSSREDAFVMLGADLGFPFDRPKSSWREDFVDQSEFHILVRSGGTDLTENEPEGIDVALIGPDMWGGLIVEFLPMFGVDPDAARDAKNGALLILNLVIPCGGDAWEYANYHCGTACNFRRLVRFVPQGGREPLEHVEYGQCTPSEFVHKQLLQTDRAGRTAHVLREAGIRRVPT